MALVGRSWQERGRDETGRVAFSLVRAIRRLTVRTVLPAALAPLGDLAANLRWSWHQETQAVFESIDPQAWQAAGRDPVRMLGQVSTERLAALAADRKFLRVVQDVADDLQEYLTGDRWYQAKVVDGPRGIGYFSPEFGVTAVLPQYSGGLGILAGDHLKAASDLGVPIIGVGLLYRHGYFRQSLSREGWQVERYPLVDPDGLPLSLLREADGTPSRIQVALPGGRHMDALIWVAQVGRVPLLLMDTDIEENAPAEREVTDRLYGGTTDHRLLQEMLLGVGGVRAIRTYSRICGAAAPEVFHTNEGHAGFLGIERIRELMADTGLDFDAALEAVRAGTLFTTHTPVPAGIDRFPRDLISQHFGGDVATPGVPIDRILELGAETYEGGDPTLFNMAVMGLRLAKRANGVSQLHGHVSREMFAGLWPRFDHSEVPISSITNGVHAPTWTAPEMQDLVQREIGLETLDTLPGWQSLAKISDQDLWALRRTLRAKLVSYARDAVRESWRQRGDSDAELRWADSVLDPDVLTIGFARRVPSYKRLTLMLRDQERLKALLLDPDRPVQLVIAGKAHPADDGGKKMIQEIVQFADGSGVRNRILFLPDYDIGMAHYLIAGCDVWLNNPLRPYEACGTSGMKSALNGGLNLSIRDGWWDEWFDGENGWAIPSAEGVGDERRDDLEAAAVYDLIEKQVAARFYDRDANGLPLRWLEMVRHTISTLGPKVLATRMVRDYVRELYTPLAASARALSGDYSGARELAGWKQRVRAAWPTVAVEHVESIGVDAAPPMGANLDLRVFVALGELEPADVHVEVVYGRVDETDELRNPRTLAFEPAESYGGGRYRYEGAIRLDRTGPFGYTVRIQPHHPALASCAELGLAAVPPSPVQAAEPPASGGS